MKFLSIPKALFVFSSSLSLFLSMLSTSEAGETYRVFILAGQSNMEGQGVVDLDHPQHYNGGRGILKRVMQNPERRELYRHIQGDDGNWIVRDDVWVRFRTKHGVNKGGLTIGFTGYEGQHHIGPEFELGHVVGEHFEEPVLLIKTAWGGKSLFKDFRPPSSGGDVGEYYQKMLAEIDEALAAAPSEFPQLAGLQPKISGFVWFQGWNDMFDDKARGEYEQNLANLIHDVRRHLKQPELPIVIGELGNGGEEAGQNMKEIRNAQAAVAKREEFKGTVTFVKTTAFARPKEDSPNVGHGHHWFGNAESYFLIGHALGEAMLKLVDHTEK